MAGDWIKMRVWISRDPRVIRMADFLASERAFMDWLTDPVRQHCNCTAHEHVTRNVTVSLCVAGLLVTWGTAREQGDREDDDLVLSHSDALTLDAMTDIPCFGEAMALVDWVVEREDGSLIFPKFFKDNESPDDKHRRQNAERQARFRAKNSNVTHNKTGNKVTQANNVTVTTEKRREEKRRKKPPSGVVRGAKKCPEDFVVTDEMREWAKERASEVRVDLETEKFRDHTFATAKTDWLGTWRNWMRKASEAAEARPKADLHEHFARGVA